MHIHCLVVVLQWSKKMIMLWSDRWTLRWLCSSSQDAQSKVGTLELQCYCCEFLLCGVVHVQRVSIVYIFAKYKNKSKTIQNTHEIKRTLFQASKKRSFNLLCVLDFFFRTLGVNPVSHFFKSQRPSSHGHI